MLTPSDRRLLVERITSGTPLLTVADEFGISRETAAGLLHRWLLNGDAGVTDRPVAKFS
jgi:hypothetical protein